MLLTESLQQHPGNLLVMKSGYLAYIDFGRMTSLEKKHRYAMIRALVSYANEDSNALALSMVELGCIEDKKEIINTAVEIIDRNL